jgi:hypothetical protein
MNLKWEYFRQILWRKSEHIFFAEKLCFESRDVYEIMWKNIVELGRPHDKMAHAYFKLYTYGHKHTLRMYVTYCFSTARVVARTRLDVKLYVHCLILFLYIYFTVRNSDGLICVTHCETHSGCAEIVTAVQREIHSVLVSSTCVYNVRSWIS